MQDFFASLDMLDLWAVLLLVIFCPLVIVAALVENFFCADDRKALDKLTK